MFRKSTVILLGATALLIPTLTQAAEPLAREEVLRQAVAVKPHPRQLAWQQQKWQLVSEDP